MIGQYLISLGEFNIDNYENSISEDDSQLLWFIFVISSFFSTIVMFNMLVAIMSETHTRLTESRSYATIAMNFRMMSDFAQFFRWLTLFEPEFTDAYCISATLDSEETKDFNSLSD